MHARPRRNSRPSAPGPRAPRCARSGQDTREPHADPVKDRRQRGQADTVAFLWGLVPFWALVVIIIFVALVGLRRSGAVLATQEGGLVASRAAAGTLLDPGPTGLEAGESAVQDLLRTWWGGDSAGSLAVGAHHPWRSVSVEMETSWDTPARRLLGLLSIRSGTFQRKEAFYAGPPDHFE